MDEHIEPLRTREIGAGLMTVTATLVGIALLTPVVGAVLVADLAVWGIQMLGRHARRGTSQAITWIIGKV